MRSTARTARTAGIPCSRSTGSVIEGLSSKRQSNVHGQSIAEVGAMTAPVSKATSEDISIRVRRQGNVTSVDSLVLSLELVEKTTSPRAHAFPIQG